MLIRRRTAAFGLGAIGLGAWAFPFRPADADEAVARAIEEFTGGAPIDEEGVVLDAPEVAENGSTVPITVEAPGADVIRLFGPANMQPNILSVRFGPRSAAHRLTTRIRLAESQEIVAIAGMPDGGFRQARARVSVTVSGCIV